MKKFLKYALLPLFLLTFLFAVSACGKDYTVSFDSDGGSTVKSVRANENDVIEREPVPEKNGYIFAGWYDGDTAVGFPYTVKGSVRFKAKWVSGDDRFYTVTFETYGGEGPDPVEARANSFLPVPEEPVRDGYRFGGWYLDEDFSNRFWFETARMPARDFTVYARWIKSVKLSFDADGGTPVPAITADGGAAIAEPEPPTKEGHVFMGWYLEDRPFVFGTMPYEDTVLKASWRKISENVTLTLHLNNAEVTAAQTTREVGGLTEGEAPALNGAEVESFLAQVNASKEAGGKEVYAFGGWYLDAACTKPLTVVPYGSDAADAYACWRRDARYAKITVESAEKRETFFLEKGEKLPEQYKEGITTESAYCEVTGFYATNGRQVAFGDEITMDLVLRPDITTKNLKFAGVRLTGDVVGYMAVVGFEDGEDAAAQDAIDLHIPAYHDGYEVRAVLSGESTGGERYTAFSGYTNIRSVTLPESVVSIGVEAFKGCTGLSSVDLTHITNIGDYAFEGCTSLNEVTLREENIVSLGARVFRDTPYETALAFDEKGFAAIGEILYLYKKPDALTHAVEVPDTFTMIAGEAFTDTDGINRITFGGKLARLGAGAFAKSGFTVVELPAGITELPENAFRESTKLTTVRLAAGSAFTSVGAYAFYGASSFRTLAYTNDNLGITGLSGLRTIGAHAFDGTVVPDLTILGPLTSIGEYAFANNAVLSAADFSYARSLTAIGAHAFENCTGMTHAILPFYLSEIADYTFYNCSSFKECGMYEGNRIARVGVSAFENCNLSLLELCTDALTVIEKDAFKNNANLEFAKLGNSKASLLSAVEGGAFAGCTSLRRIALYTGIVNGKAVEFRGNWIDGGAVLNFYVEAGAPEVDASSDYYENGVMRSYFDIYTEVFAGAEGITVCYFDTVSPTLAIADGGSSVIEAEVSAEERASFDILAKILEWNKLTVEDDKSESGNCQLKIRNVTSTMFRVSAKEDGTYDLTRFSEYRITLYAEDEFGNESEDLVITLKITTKEVNP